MAGVAEGRHPLTVDQPGVPADVVTVHVGAHHEVDVVRVHPGGGEVVQEVGAQHVERRVAGPLLVVADAGVDQDGAALAAQHPGPHRRDQQVR